MFITDTVKGDSRVSKPNRYVCSIFAIRSSSLIEKLNLKESSDLVKLKKEREKKEIKKGKDL